MKTSSQKVNAHEVSSILSSLFGSTAFTGLSYLRLLSDFGSLKVCLLNIKCCISLKIDVLIYSSTEYTVNKSSLESITPGVLYQRWKCHHFNVPLKIWIQLSENLTTAVIKYSF